MGIELNSGNTIESYKKLNKFDLNKDDKVSLKEVEFLSKLDNLPKNFTKDNVTDLLKNLDKSESRGGTEAIVNKILASMGKEKITLQDLKDIINKLPDDIKLSAKEYLATAFKSQGLSLDNSNNLKISPNNKALNINKEFIKEQKESYELAKDVLNNDGKIKGVDYSIAQKFEKSLFDPTGNSSFNFKVKSKVGDGYNQSGKANDKDDNNLIPDNASAGEITVDLRYDGNSERAVDIETGNKIDVKPMELRESLAKINSFDKFAKDNNLFKADGSLDPSKLDKVKEFIATLPDKKTKLDFTSKFLTAYFVHSGASASQQNLNSSNVEKLFALKDNQGTGRFVIDCNIYSSISQRLIGDNNDLKLINVDMGNKKGDIGHHVSFIKSVGTDGKPEYFLQSNNQITKLDPQKINKYMNNGNIESSDLVSVAQSQGLLSDDYFYKGENYNNNALASTEYKQGGAIGTYNGNEVFVDNEKDGLIKGTTINPNDPKFIGRVVDKNKELNGTIFFKEDYKLPNGADVHIDNVRNDGIAEGKLKFQNQTADILVMQNPKSEGQKEFMYLKKIQLEGREVNINSIDKNGNAIGTFKDTGEQVKINYKDGNPIRVN
ncbi:MAG: hypothetical protein U0354_18350 [Candidatus Sericytochromatia bacterium]